MDRDGDGYDDETGLWVGIQDAVGRSEEDDEEEPDRPTFIGVDDDYVAVRPLRPSNPSAWDPRDGDVGTRGGPDLERRILPRYVTGADFAMGNASPNEIFSINNALVQTGLVDWDDFQNPSAYGPTSRSTMAKLMTMANATGITWYEAAAQLAAGAEFRAARDAAGRPRGPSRAPFVARPPNRDEVKRAYRNVRIQGLGGQWATRKDPALQAEEEAFADKFEADVVGAQRAAYDGRTVEDPASLEASALTNLEETDQAGLNANRFRQYAQVMTEALGG